MHVDAIDRFSGDAAGNGPGQLRFMIGGFRLGGTGDEGEASNKQGKKFAHDAAPYESNLALAEPFINGWMNRA
jgi:hypothetical protein